MASIKISELDNVTTLSDSDALPIVNGDKTKKVTINKLGDILATKDYVTEQISSLGDMGFTPVVVTSLPTSNIKTNTIYLKLSGDDSEQNIYDEWMYINNKWEQIGSTKIDLSEYATIEYVKNAINVVNLDVSGFKANTFEITGSTTGYASSDANVKAALEKIAKLGSKNCLLYIHNGYGSAFCTFTGDFNSSNGGYGHYYVGFYTDDTSDRNSVKYTVTCNYSSNGSPTNISIIYNTMQGFPCTSNVLTKTNTASYTPSANYHPATKKYVDDSIKAAITTTLASEY